MIVELLSTEAAAGGDPRPDRPDPGGVVRRGAAAERVASYARHFGEAPPCFAGGAELGCARPGTMEVCGLVMCAVHGEEAAAGALEEIAYDLEQELQRLDNPYVRPLSPHLDHALRRGHEVLRGEGGRAEREGDALMLAAFPLDRSRAHSESIAYAKDPDAHGRGHREPPSEMFRRARMLLHRHMRLAFEEEAGWLVETLEEERVQVATQCAYALALEPDAYRPTIPERKGDG